MNLSINFLAAALLLPLPLVAQTQAPAKTAAPGTTSAQVQPQPPKPDPMTDPNAIRVLLSPELETTLVAQMVGRIASLNAPLGGLVTKGKTIIAFDCSEAGAKLQMAQAEYVSAKENLDAKTRLRKLDAAGDMEVSMADAAANRAKASISLSRAQLGQCTVAAPFSGRIVKIYVKPHQGVNIGNPLVEMISDGPLKLRLNVSSKLLRTLRVGTPFEVDIDETAKTYPAKVTAINARVDAVARSVELEARIDGTHPELLAGMTGIAHIKSGF